MSRKFISILTMSKLKLSSMFKKDKKERVGGLGAIIDVNNSTIL